MSKGPDAIDKLIFCAGPPGSGKTSAIMGKIPIQIPDAGRSMAAEVIGNIPASPPAAGSDSAAGADLFDQIPQFAYQWSMVLRKDVPNLCGSLDRLIIHHDTFRPRGKELVVPSAEEDETVIVDRATFCSALLFWAPPTVLLERNIDDIEKLASYVLSTASGFLDGSRNLSREDPVVQRISWFLRRLRFLADPVGVCAHYQQWIDFLGRCQEFWIVDSSADATHRLVAPSDFSLEPGEISSQARGRLTRIETLAAQFMHRAS